jgi:NAD(P)-dependent dehydrogenase (short-subunit alcohol dehydrogenase family)
VRASASIVAPSLTVTEMGKRLARATMGAEDIHSLDKNMPFGRVSTPEDVASAVTWLVSSANPYANGQKININGGG